MNTVYSRRSGVAIVVGGLALLLIGNLATAQVPSPAPAAAIGATIDCAALPAAMAGHFPDATTRLTSAHAVAAGPLSLPTGGPEGLASVMVPGHCEVTGILQERTGAGGQQYAIRFHLRLPQSWNGRFFFQGGGGSNGNLGDALGRYSAAAPAALAQGFAVVSQDSGHDNTLNNDPAHAGQLVFGFDAKARANYGHASLPLVSQAAKAVIKAFYGAAPRFSYFVGCSKGGEEGMVLAQRYPQEFDGISAGAPGMSLPRAAIAEAWDTQALAASASADASGKVTVNGLAAAVSAADLALVRDAVLAACDADDGVKDGVVGDFTRCTAARVLPQLKVHRCPAAKTDSCLTDTQIASITRLMAGAQDSQGHALYASWPWDTGLAEPGWRAWKLGGGPMPALNVVLGGGSLASVFTTPPTALGTDPQQALDFLLHFNFDRDAPRIYATSAEFPHAAWEEVSARSADLSGFQARRGRLLVYHGVSDPVFSINDTLAWWREVDRRTSGKASDVVRVFPVPGMNHCGGGAATDAFDVMPALMGWVEHAEAPRQIAASAGAHTPWPGRTRPLCAYPAVARYTGKGDINRAESFACRN